MATDLDRGPLERRGSGGQRRQRVHRVGVFCRVGICPGHRDPSEEHLGRVRCGVRADEHGSQQGLGSCPLREFPPSHPAGSCLAWPRWPSISLPAWTRPSPQSTGPACHLHRSASDSRPGPLGQLPRQLLIQTIHRLGRHIHRHITHRCAPPPHELHRCSYIPILIPVAGS